MNKNKLVSVIVPVYNCEKYLSQCLDTLLSQTIKEIEIICVDDDSNSETKNILHTYLCSDERIRVISNESNRGAGYSRNIGLINAVGEYIYFVDSDDLCTENMLEECYVYAKKNNLDIVICDYIECDEKTGEDIQIIRQLPFAIREEKKVFNCCDILNSIFNISTTATWNKLYKREFLLEYDIKFSELRNSEDIYFNSILLVLAKRIGKMENALFYKYRVNRKEQLSGGLDKNIYEALKELIKIKEKLEELGRYDEFKVSFENLFYDVMMYSFAHISRENADTLIDYYKSEVAFKVNNCLNIERIKTILNESNMEAGCYEKHCKVMKLIRKYRFLQFLDAIKGRNVVVWGAALRGKALGQELHKYNMDKVRYVDVDNSKWNETVCGYPISGVESVSDWVDVIVIVNSRYTKEIRKMSASSIKKNFIIVELDTYMNSFYDYNDCCISKL